MLELCKEVRTFVSACEDVHAKMIEGGKLTVDERDVVEESALDLLARIQGWSAPSEL
jgi:hypothetical protein